LEKKGKGGFIVYAVPSRYETPGKGIWLFNSYERNFLLTEYAKIVLFLLYSSFFFFERREAVRFKIMPCGHANKST